MTPPAGDITVILQRWDTDRDSAIEALTPIVYQELHKIAASFLRRQGPGQTLQPTALINEAYMRLVKQDEASLRDRSHFYALAARMMRQILLNAARDNRAQKRGSGNVVQLDANMEIGAAGHNLDFMALHDALEKLQVHNARMAQVVELRFFGGLQLEEIAAALTIGLATVKRDLTLGQAYLRNLLAG
jgi:RNA polymerase sigma factor (TIGR02999 family)